MVTSFRTEAFQTKASFTIPKPWSPGTSVRGTLAPSGCVRIACLFCFVPNEEGQWKCLLFSWLDLPS